jgi:hypothetical protein
MSATASSDTLGAPLAICHPSAFCQRVQRCYTRAPGRRAFS